MHACSVAKLCWLFVTPWTVACQAHLSMGFSWQEYWSGLLFPPPRDPPNPGIKPASPALAGRFSTTEPPGKPLWSQGVWTRQSNKILWISFKTEVSPLLSLVFPIPGYHSTSPSTLFASAIVVWGFSGGTSGKESASQCRRCRFDPWGGKIAWRMKRQPIPVFLPGKSHGQRSLVGSSPWSLKRAGHDLATKWQQSYGVNCISWISRLTLLDLQTNRTYEHALGMVPVCMWGT